MVEQYGRQLDVLDKRFRRVVRLPCVRSSCFPGRVGQQAPTGLACVPYGGPRLPLVLLPAAMPSAVLLAAHVLSDPAPALAVAKGAPSPRACVPAAVNVEAAAGQTENRAAHRGV